MTNTNNWQNYEGFVLAARDAGTAGKKLTLLTSGQNFCIRTTSKTQGQLYRLLGTGCFFTLYRSS